jgi:hypothetical protein
VNKRAYKASISHALLPAIATSDAVARAINEDDKPSPKRIASLACDIASALADELEAREWVAFDTDVPATASGGLQ